MENNTSQFVSRGSQRLWRTESPFHLAVILPEIILRVVQTLRTEPQCNRDAARKTNQIKVPVAITVLPHEIYRAPALEVRFERESAALVLAILEDQVAYAGMKVLFDAAILQLLETDHKWTAL